MKEKYDVIVAGGGPAGVAAAVAASRSGCNTLLIEQEAYFGGMATLASVPAFGPFTNGEQDLIGGIGREILEELKKDGYKSPFYDRKPDRIEGIDWYPIDPEHLKRVMDDLVTDSGCDVLFHTIPIPSIFMRQCLMRAQKMRNYIKIPSTGTVNAMGFHIAV
ncbi:FAD-dependent oxidoreductase [Clostridium boliviensis]|uniref:FAD-dependent oxidoreductase n=1 Tax=Clostridium boliviensis TaxID=318465 RepID=A0ABU4GMC5_9CLOT|nr:FAD-dependent oxidoreductase [Clostridium boliviensis]MDW2798756.1 FAD-dependent oxidoreductase [Clostridium boliviensis]